MPENNSGNGSANRLSGLAAMLQNRAEKGHPPVEQWNPDYCGDIGLEIMADGTWWYRGSPIDRPALVKLFAGVLRKDTDGRTYLVTPAEKVDVIVADAPFLAIEMETIGTAPHQELVFRTNVDDVVTCGPAHPLRFAVDEATGGIKPYLLVRGRLEALVTRTLTHDLLELAMSTEPAGVRSGGVLFLVPDSYGSKES